MERMDTQNQWNEEIWHINETDSEKNKRTSDREKLQTNQSSVRTLTGFFPTQIIVYKKTKIKTQKKLDRSME